MRRTISILLAVGLAGTVGCEKQKEPDSTRDLLKPEGGKAGGSRARRPPPPIPAKDRAMLLKLARRSLVASVTGTYPRSLTDGLSISARVKERQGAFVTLKKSGRLRGCIGTILPRVPLYQAVIKNAKNAALHDGRFQQVTIGELQQIEIEISALSVPRRAQSYREIVVGKHGIILRRGGRSATYLPHVATEQKWDRATTLTHLCRKAGLGIGAWKDPKTLFHVYTAEVWSEKGGH